MDVQRQDVAARKRKRRILWIGGGVALVVLIGLGLSQLESPVYKVYESSVWVETVKRGELLREVSGIGTLVPESNRLITSSTAGIVEELIIYPGTKVEPDSIILVMSNPQLVLDAENARFDVVADPKQLKAVIQISETQAKDITIGQSTTIDTRNGVVIGRVMRVDPTVVNGTVAVDIELPDTLPRGARPDLTVEGKIELENMADVIYVARPAFARENSSMGIYKFDVDGNSATRTTVQFGRSSVSSIEVLAGLNPGESIIASDTSQFETHNRIQIQ